MTDPALPIAAVKAYWEARVDDWKIATHEPGSKGFFEETERYRFEKLEYLGSHVPMAGCAGKSVLEIGCGIGNDLSRFARAGAHVTGIDIADRAIELSRSNFDQRALNGQFVQMDGEALAFDDNTFDLAYCHTVLQFTPNPERLIDEIHRVLKPGGKALIMVLNRRSWLMWMHRVFKVRIDYLDSPVYHLFSVDEFHRMLDRFDDCDVFTERFPVKTEVHKGLKAKVFNLVFVDCFNLLPRALTRSSGHHILAYVTKRGEPGVPDAA
jgi:SAM-dependent methyltransferase